MRKVFFYLLVVILLAQLIRPHKNSGKEVSKNNISTQLNLPENIQGIINRSCNDCHSNNTNYQWYHAIAPFSWVVASHVKEGKEHLNFSEWATYNENQKEHIIDELKETISAREMPLVGYLKFHPEAVLSDVDNQKLLDWIKDLEVQNVKVTN